MSHSIISNFDWKLQWLDHEEEARIFTKSCCPPRLDEENQCLVPFDLKTRKYLVEQSVSAQGQNMARLKLFVTKYFLLCFTLLVNKRSAFTRMLFCRLSQYVDYYELILGEIYKGNTTILNEWWNIEATYQNCQHSWGRTKNTGGPLCDRKVITYSCIVWDLDNIMNADWSRLGFVTMDAKTFYLTEWIFDELERLHEDSWEDEQTDPSSSSSDDDGSTGPKSGTASGTKPGTVSGTQEEAKSGTMSGTQPGAGTMSGTILVTQLRTESRTLSATQQCPGPELALDHSLDQHDLKDNDAIELNQHHTSFQPPSTNGSCAVLNADGETSNTDNSHCREECSMRHVDSVSQVLGPDESGSRNSNNNQPSKRLTEREASKIAPIIGYIKENFGDSMKYSDEDIITAARVIQDLAEDGAMQLDFDDAP